jgi:hypothetical protein
MHNMLVAALAATLASVIAADAAVAGEQFKNPALSPGLPATTDPSGAAAVGKLINPQPRDPSVPLPDPNLADKERATAPDDRPQFYGEPKVFGATDRDPGVLGAQVGVKIPIPAGPGGSSGNTTYSGGENGSSTDSRSR